MPEVPFPQEVSKSPRQTFDHWKVLAICSLAIAIVNLGILIFLTMAVWSSFLDDATVINTNPRRVVIEEPVSSESASPTPSPEIER